MQVGFAVLDRLASQEGIRLEKSKVKALVGTSFCAGQKVILAQPQSFMNLSGQVVGQLSTFYKVCHPPILQQLACRPVLQQSAET